MRRLALLALLALLAAWTGSAAAADQNWIDPENVPVPEAVTLRNAACEAVVWTKPFVRLASFRLAGGKNHLIDFRSPNPVAGPRFLRPLYVTGAKLWLAGDFDGTRFGLLPGSVTARDARSVSVSIGPDPATGIAASVRFELDPKEPRVTLSTVLRNTGGAARSLACWWPVSFVPGGRLEAEAVPFPEAPRFRFASWHHDVPSAEPACRIDGGRVALDLDRPLRDGHDLFELGLLSREIVVEKPDVRYRLAVVDPAPGPARVYPPGGAAILYEDRRTWFCEAELQGPVVALPPGGSTDYRFAISLEPVPPAK